MNTPYVINFNDFGVKVNKDVDHHLGLFKLHKAGSTKGTGLYSNRKIHKDEEIIRVTGPGINREIESTLYLSYGIDISIQNRLSSWILPNNESRFINHSCQPNMGFKQADIFVALRDIKEGEELTFDYSMNEIDVGQNLEWVMDCKCNSNSCRKKITNMDIFNPKYKLYEKYKGYLPRFVVKELAKRGLI